MKFFLQIIVILIIFLKTGNLLSSENLFSVNNILIEKKDGISSKQLADQAIKEGFNRLGKRILLNQDKLKIADLPFSSIKELISYYNISKNFKEDENKLNFKVAFDKDKLHDLFYRKKILYSDIINKEFYILPILIEKNDIFIFSNNFFYSDWNKVKTNDLIEFILPLENIEIIQKINRYRDKLFELKLNSIFKEYLNKNIAIVLIDNNKKNEIQIYLKTRIEGKEISKALKLNTKNPDLINFKENIILKIKNTIIDLTKFQNLIDVNTPSFLNVNLELNKTNNLVLLNSRIEKIDLIENIYIQELSNNYVKLRIKYLGKLEKITDQLRKNNIDLEILNDQWFIKIL